MPRCASDAECRRGTDQDYDAALDVRVSALELASESDEAVRLELDLDAVHPATATSTIAEGFESGLGIFQAQSLDSNLASNSLSNGYRCQYNSPYRPGCGATDCPEPCYLGFFSGQSPLNGWHAHTSGAPDGGRAYLGARSVHYGVHVTGNPGLDTYQLSQLDSLRSSSGIRLAARICRDDPSPDPQACASDQDCAGGGLGECVGATPKLSIKQQISTVDSRSTTTPYGSAVDRGVVQARVTGTGIWRTLSPIVNPHDVQAASEFSNCTFDPVDDGSDETHWFADANPYHPFGPSSTCFPEFAFSWLGDTDQPFSPANVGRAADGHGLPGALGPGTWVESVFDLSPFRGRAVQIRFLFTSIKLSDIDTYQSAFAWNPIPDDDGWYLDDVRITQTLGTTSLATALDESAPPLPGNDADADGIDDACDVCPGIPNADQRDLDGDAIGDPCDPDDDGDGQSDSSDCEPASPTAWSAPGPARDLQLQGRLPTVLRWEAPLSPGAAEIWYDVVLATDPSDLNPGFCFAASTLIQMARDVEPEPDVGTTHFYVVMAANQCGRNAGAGSSGTPRPTLVCP